MGHPHTKVYDNILQAIGGTPMVRLGRVTDGCRTPVLGKCEFMNPGGSVKDRIGVSMVEAAELDGTLKPGGVVVEATAGNTGMGLALAAALKGYRCIFTMPDKMSVEKVKLLRALGAEVVITPTAVAADHPDNYLQTARRIASETPGAILANQFYNPANPRAHYENTGPEIWAQTEGRVTHYVAAAATGGTLSGAGAYLKEQNPEVRIIGCDPEGSIIAEFYRTGEMTEGSPYKVEGAGNDKIAGTLNLDIVDEYRVVPDGESFRMGLRMAREEGLFVGGSTGLNMVVALEVARELDDPDSMVVVILPDWGEHYLTKMYDEDWMRENGFLPRTTKNAHDLLQIKMDGGLGLITVSPSSSVREALEAITTHDVSQLPVCEGSECVGSVAEGDLMARVLERNEILDDPVDTVMGEPFPIIDSHRGADEATRLLTRENAAVLVWADGEFEGIITRYDVIQTLTAAT